MPDLYDHEQWALERRLADDRHHFEQSLLRLSTVARQELQLVRDRYGLARRVRRHPWLWLFFAAALGWMLGQRAAAPGKCRRALRS